MTPSELCQLVVGPRGPAPLVSTNGCAAWATARYLGTFGPVEAWGLYNLRTGNPTYCWLCRDIGNGHVVSHLVCYNRQLKRVITWSLLPRTLRTVALQRAIRATLTGGPLAPQNAFVPPPPQSPA